SLRPWLLLRQAGVEFEEVGLLLDTPGFAAEAARHSPTGKVPVNSQRRPDAYRWDAAAQNDIDRVQALFALPALRQWRQVAARETARVAATDALCQPH